MEANHTFSAASQAFQDEIFIAEGLGSRRQVVLDHLGTPGAFIWDLYDLAHKGVSMVWDYVPTQPLILGGMVAGATAGPAIMGAVTQAAHVAPIMAR